METSQAILEWLEDLPALQIYVILFFSSWLENLFPPWPGDTLIVIGGFLAARGKSELLFSFVSILMGNLAGASTMYFTGERLVQIFNRLYARLRQPFLRRILEPLCKTEQLDKVRNWFERWGAVFVLFSRFSAGVRFFVSIAAGLVQMNFLFFLLCFAGGVLIWNSLLLWGGWLLRESWADIIQWLQIYNWLFFGLVFMLVLLWIFWKLKNRFKESYSK